MSKGVGRALGFTPGKTRITGTEVRGIGERFKDPLSATLADVITPVARGTLAATRDPFRLPVIPGVRDFPFGSQLQQFGQRGRFGLDPAFDEAIGTLGRQLFGRASAAAARRGQLAPENISAVVGSAVREAAPQLARFADISRQRELFGPAQLARQIQAIRQQPVLTEEALRQQRVQQALAATGTITGALGGARTQFGTAPLSPFARAFGGAVGQQLGGFVGGLPKAGTQAAFTP